VGIGAREWLILALILSPYLCLVAVGIRGRLVDDGLRDYKYRLPVRGDDKGIGGHPAWPWE
jgi:hypothetical protein